MFLDLFLLLRDRHGLVTAHFGLKLIKINHLVQEVDGLLVLLLELFQVILQVFVAGNDFFIGELFFQFAFYYVLLNLEELLIDLFVLVLVLLNIGIKSVAMLLKEFHVCCHEIVIFHQLTDGLEYFHRIIR